jgi:hypothetical protein
MRYYKQNCALHCTVREKMIQNFEAIFCKANWNIASNRSAATIAFARKDSQWKLAAFASAAQARVLNRRILMPLLGAHEYPNRSRRKRFFE